MHVSQQILNALTAHIVLLDNAGNIVATNEAWDHFAQANGAPNSVVTGIGVNYLAVCRTAIDTDDPEAAVVAAGITDVLAGKRDSFTLEYPCHAPNEQRWFVLRVTPRGDGTGVIVTHEAITAQKVSAEMNARLAAIVDASDDAIFSKTLDGTIVSWNGGAERIYGYLAAQAIGQPITMLMPPDQQDEAAQLLARLRRGERITNYERVRVRSDGQRIIVALSISPICDTQGTIIGASVIARDITMRTQVERALRESEARYHLLFENNLDAVLLTSPDGQILDANSAACAMFGCTVEELRQIGRAGVVNRADPRLPQMLAERTRTGRLVGELTLMRSDGTSFPAEISSTMFRDQSGELRTSMIARDITARKQAEETLLAREQQYRELVEHASDGIFISDMHGKYLDVNTSGCLMLGYSRDELLHRSLSDLVSQEELAARPFQIDELRAGQVIRIERHMKRKDGTLIPVEISARMLPDGRLLGIVRDITKRRRAEAALRSSEQRFRSFFENLSGPITIIEARRDGRGEIVDWVFCDANPVFLQLLGVERDALRDRSVLAIIGPEPTAWNMPQYHHVLSTGQPCIYESAFQEQHFLLTLFRIDMDTLAITGIDITVRKQVEQALKLERAMLTQRVEERTTDLRVANAELARAARMKDEFLANMSHELRTPLSTILGLSEALQEQLYGPLAAKQYQAIDNVRESGRHLLALINDILDLAKAEAGQVTLELERVDVVLLCEAAMRMIRQVALTRQVKTTISFDESVVSVWADVRRLKQILINLLANAVKFTPVGGNVGLEVRGDSGQQQVRFTVWDTGIGIAETDIGRLFQPFVQVDSRLARAYEGTGLGLALVARLTELHGGSVTVSSTVGQGSRFTISLPWQAFGEAMTYDGISPAEAIQGAPRGVATAARWVSSRRMLILLAEDNAANSRMVAEYLEIHGCQVIVAHSGAEAVQLAHADRPDVILMDIQMPGMDGLEAMKHIRSQGIATPIIALTALAMPGDQERCLAAGAQAYLTKPVSLQNLREVMLSLLAVPDTGGQPVLR